jgi:single-stranded-DNA-specific exonuclease
VALATVCDVAPPTGVNRAFVVKGLQMARQQRMKDWPHWRGSAHREPVSTFTWPI